MPSSPKKNLILFTGSDVVRLESELSGWKKLFIEKHGELNVYEVDCSGSLNDINPINEMLAPGFMSMSRLIILSGIPVDGSRKAKIDETTGEEITDTAAIIQEQILENIENIPDENFVLFVQPHPDKRKKFYKELIKLVTIKNYDPLEGPALASYIQSKLPNIQSGGIRELMKRLNNDPLKIDAAIKLLQTYKPNHPISQHDVDLCVPPILESIIFRLVDAITAKNARAAIHEVDILLQHENIFAIYASLMGNLRKMIYAHQAQSSGIQPKSIGLTPYFTGKYKPHFTPLYQQLVEGDYRVKTGQSTGAGEEALRRELEKAILQMNTHRL